MEPMTIAAIGAGAVIVGTSVAGMMSNAADRRRAEGLSADAYALMEQTGWPPEIANEIVLEKYRSQGLLSPELEQAIAMEKSAGIAEDPKVKMASMNALQSYKQLSAQGFTPADMADMRVAQRSAAQVGRSRIAQLGQQMQARGMGGAGAEYGAQRDVAAQEAQAAAEAGDKALQNRQAARMAALGKYGELGTQVRGQDIQKGAYEMQAANEMEKARTAMEASRQQRNIGAKNTINAANLAEKQRIADANVGLTNQEIYHKTYAPLMNWKNKMGYAQGLAGMKLGQASDYTQSGAQKQQAWSNLGLGAGQAIMGMAG